MLDRTMHGLLEKWVVPRLEKIMLVFLLLLAGGWFVGGFVMYTPNPRRFPVMSAGFVLFTGIIILVWNRLPESIQAWEAEDPLESISEELTQAGEALEGGVQQPDEPDEDTVPFGKYNILPLHYHVGIISILYFMLGALFGYLWPTPVIVYVYCRVTDQSWPITAGLTILAAILGFVFYSYLQIPVHQGYLQRMGLL